VVVAAEFGVGQVLWSLFWFYLFAMWVMLLFFVFADIIRSDDLPGTAKALWTAVILFVPYLGVFAYIVARGETMSRRADPYRRIQS
jgi:hypothetical protein